MTKANRIFEAMKREFAFHNLEAETLATLISTAQGKTGKDLEGYLLKMQKQLNLKLGEVEDG